MQKQSFVMAKRSSELAYLNSYSLWWWWGALCLSC